MQIPRNRRIMGIETEYAADVQKNLSPLIDAATHRLIYCNAYASTQRMLGNGSLLYLDSGNHPELSTPETDNPTDAVTYILAGDEIVSRGANAIGHYLGKNNVDYLSMHTWGAHESYMAVNSIQPALLIPHLATRIIYTGAGGLHPNTLEFCLSPRVRFLSMEVSGSTTDDRGLYNTKIEPLGGEFDPTTSSYSYERIHLICGEALCSQTALWLKLATTALVIRLAEEIPTWPLNKRPKIPYIDLDSMKIFNADPTLKAKSNGYTALDVQNIYLDTIESHLGEDWLPVWAEEACQRWRNMLEMLKEPESASRTLDWAIKYQLFNMHKEKGPDTGRYQSLTNIHELMEIDLIFSRLSPEPGIFQQLDAAGVLEHRLINHAVVEHAIHNAPTGTRAELRGQIISEAGDTERIRAYWMGVVDIRSRQAIFLSDPFQTEFSWVPLDLVPSAYTNDGKYEIYQLLPIKFG